MNEDKGTVNYINTECLLSNLMALRLGVFGATVLVVLVGSLEFQGDHRGVPSIRTQGVGPALWHSR